MSQANLTKTGFASGVWQGILRDAGDGVPALQVLRDGAEQPGLSLTVRPGEDGAWNVRFAVPPDGLSDGSAVFLFRLEGRPGALADLTILAGEALDGDPRRELAQLRAELDLVKRVLRRELGTARPG